MHVFHIFFLFLSAIQLISGKYFLSLPQDALKQQDNVSFAWKLAIESRDARVEGESIKDHS